jgi:hypothetical protein
MAAAAVRAHGDSVYCTWDECTKECGDGTRVCQRSNGKKWVHQCHVQECEPVEGCGRGDIMYVLDSSASIGDKNYWVLKQFTIDVMKGLNLVDPGERTPGSFLVGATETRIGCVLYSDHAELQWGLAAGDNVDFLEQQLWALPWLATTTNTYQGLQYAYDVIKAEGRGDVKQIVILMTDGVSNHNVGKAVPLAEEMRQNGVEIFVIGIGDQIDEDECIGIASDKKEDHYFRVPSYTALIAITNILIQDTCKSTNQTQCGEWSEWSDCKLSDSRRRRRDAVHVSDECGPGEQTRERDCTFWLYEGADPEHRTAVETRPCELPCEPPVDPPEECPPEDPCTDTTCSLTPTDDNCARFEKCVRMCECVIGDETTCENDPLTHFTFTKNFNDVSCQAAMGHKVGGGVSLQAGAARFDGTGIVEVPFFKDYFKRNPSSALSVNLWFRPADAVQQAGLVCNAGCVDGGTVALAIDNGAVTASIKGNLDVQLGDKDTKYIADAWNMVTIVYTGTEAKLYVNGLLVSQKPAQGNVVNSGCTMTIGGCEKAYYKGYLDDVRVYRRMLFDYDVQTIFNNGRN